MVASPRSGSAGPGPETGRTRKPLWAFRSTEGSNPSPSASQAKIRSLSRAFAGREAASRGGSDGSTKVSRTLRFRPFVPPTFPRASPGGQGRATRRRLPWSGDPRRRCRTDQTLDSEQFPAIFAAIADLAESSSAVDFRRLSPPRALSAQYGMRRCERLQLVAETTASTRKRQVANRRAFPVGVRCPWQLTVSRGGDDGVRRSGAEWSACGRAPARADRRAF
jgi:hypothetical protein